VNGWGAQRTSALGALLLGACLAVSACGGDSPPAEEGSEPTTAAEIPRPLETGISEDLDEKPSIVIPPKAAPPTTLETADIVEGAGREAQPGDTLEVDYVGVSYETGKEFDSSYGRKRQFSFQLGRGMVIPGWDQGLEGMKKGGRRLLTIPPELAYGSQGAPPVIGPNETLVFVVDLVKLGE